MKKVDQILKTITFEEANQVIKFQDVYKIMSGNPEVKFSKPFKKILFLLSGLIIPVGTIINFIQDSHDSTMSPMSRGVGIFSELLIIILMIYFFLKPYDQFIENYGYKNFCYTLA